MVGVNIRMQQQTWIEPRIWVNLLVSVGHQSIYGHHMLPFAILIRGFIYIYIIIYYPIKIARNFQKLYPPVILEITIGNIWDYYWI